MKTIEKEESKDFDNDNRSNKNFKEYLVLTAKNIELTYKEIKSKFISTIVSAIVSKYLLPYVHIVNISLCSNEICYDISRIIDYAILVVIVYSIIRLTHTLIFRRRLIKLV